MAKVSKGKKSPPKVVATSKGALTKDQQARFGVGAGPVSGAERGRINRATQKKASVESKGETYFSPYDTDQRGGGSEAAGYAAGMADLSGSAMGTGGGGMNPGQKNLDAYTRVLQGMINRGASADPYNKLESELQGLYGQAQTGLQGQYDTSNAKLQELIGGAGTQINTAMDELQGVLQAQQNPYQGFVAQQAQAVPGLNELLGSQGVSTDPVARMATALNAGNAGQAAAFQNMANQFGNIYGANQQGMLGDVAQQRAAAQTGLANQGAAYGQQLAGGFQSDTNALAKQLLGERSGLAESRTGAGNDMLKMLLAALQAGGNLGKGGIRGS